MPRVSWCSVRLWRRVGISEWPSTWSFLAEGRDVLRAWAGASPTDMTSVLDHSTAASPRMAAMTGIARTLPTLRFWLAFLPHYRQHPLLPHRRHGTTQRPTLNDTPASTRATLIWAKLAGRTSGPPVSVPLVARPTKRRAADTRSFTSRSSVPRMMKGLMRGVRASISWTIPGIRQGRDMLHPARGQPLYSDKIWIFTQFQYHV